jgi:peptidoglycan/LPS O-acetylase OafA/YrhL
MLIWGAAAFLTVIGVVAGEPLARTFPPPRFLVLIGDASYSIYLIHTIILGFTRGVFRAIFYTGDWWIPLFVFACIVSSMIGGLLFYFAVEKPLVRTATRLVTRRG